MEDVQETTGNYSKRPLWQWVLLYVVLGVVVYGLVYYFVFAKKGAYTVQQNQYSPSPTVASAAPSANIYLTKTDAKKGSYMTDFAGITLYTYDKDTVGVSNCINGCAAVWPPYTSGATAEKNLPTNITVITRSDGSKQFAWKGKPLYYYASDTKPGEMTGDGIGGVWHIILP